nr:MAG TPA: hypothetical protein [Caudoviricetes sp.]
MASVRAFFCLLKRIFRNLYKVYCSRLKFYS